MENLEIIKGDKLIGLHENYIVLHNFEYETPMKKWVAEDVTQIGEYHTSWDWLMPVVDRIETETNCIVDIRSNAIFIHDVVDDKQISFIEVDGITDRLNATYKAVIEFIKWYNNNY